MKGWRFQSSGLWSSRFEYLRYNFSVLKMRAATSSNTLIGIYQNTWILISDRVIFIVITMITSSLTKQKALWISTEHRQTISSQWWITHECNHMHQQIMIITLSSKIVIICFNKPSQTPCNFTLYPQWSSVICCFLRCALEWLPSGHIWLSNEIVVYWCLIKSKRCHHPSG
jgi:hypothetical protein